MAKVCRKLTSDDKFWLTKDDTSANAAVTFLLHTPEGVRESAALSTYEIGLLASSLVHVYFDRTKRVIWPVAGPILEHYEKAKLDAEQGLVDWLKTSPDPENRARGNALAAQQTGEALSVVKTEPVVETKPSCQFCDEFGACTGDCL
jgi:hypothetical protein